jgi:hypothetical protein
MNCLSTIAANLPGSFVGTAPKSNYFLYRTEDVSSEYPIEEQTLLPLQNGQTASGWIYSLFRLGTTLLIIAISITPTATWTVTPPMITRASDYAARKGILVVVAAGNTGNGIWHYIIAPGDADSVLTIGAVNASGQVAVSALWANK